MDFNEFRDKFNKFMENIIEWNSELKNTRFWDGSHITQVEENTFTIESWTSMYNGPYDIPEYMRYIIVASHIEDEVTWFKMDKFEVEHD